MPFSRRHHAVSAAVPQRLNVVRFLIEFFEDGRIELYNLKHDPMEQQDLARTEPELAAKLQKQLQSWRKRVGAQMPVPNRAYAPASGPPGTEDSD